MKTILIVEDNPINNRILPLIEQEIRRNYELKDWEKFNYLTVDIPLKAYIWQIIIMIITQGLCYWYTLNNEFDQGGVNVRRRYRR